MQPRLISGGRHPFVKGKSTLDMPNLLEGNLDFGLSMPFSKTQLALCLFLLFQPFRKSTEANDSDSSLFHLRPFFVERGFRLRSQVRRFDGFGNARAELVPSNGVPRPQATCMNEIKT